MTIGIATSVRNSKMAQISAAVDSGSSTGKLRIYDGTRPMTGGTVTTMLVELEMSDPSFGLALHGAITAENISSGVTVATGVASWFRIVSSDDLFVLDGSVGSDLILNNNSFTTGVQVDITSLVLTDADL